MKTYQTPKQACPVCSHVLDRTMGRDDSTQPVPGDITFCIGCTAILVFDQQMKLAPITPEFIAGLSPELKATIETRHRVLISALRN